VEGLRSAGLGENPLKILVLMNAHALAHVSRPLEVAKILRERGYEFLFAGHGKYLKIAAREGFETADLPFIPYEQVVNAIRAQKLDELYVEDQLEEYIAAELELYEQVSPDLLLIDDRATAFTSGELAGLKRACIVNVHMSRYRQIPFFSPRVRLGGGPVTRLLEMAENQIEFFYYNKLVMSDMNKVREKHGLDKKYGYAIEEGDLVLLPDIPEFSPCSPLPPNVHFIGPLTWHNDLPAPKAVSQLDPDKKCIYFTLGSAGVEDLISQLGVLAEKDIQVVIAKGGSADSISHDLPENMFLEDFVNTDTLFPHCDLIVCHGGNGTIYQALGYGLPMVGIATHEEQNYGLKRLKALGLGLGFHTKQLEKEGMGLIVEAIDEVLGNEKYRNNALRFKGLLGGLDAASTAADLVDEFARSSH
jgi:UDP:flavonoid glycosyltransferase YjiC (YdhE family)